MVGAWRQAAEASAISCSIPLESLVQQTIVMENYMRSIVARIGAVFCSSAAFGSAAGGDVGVRSTGVAPDCRVAGPTPKSRAAQESATSSSTRSSHAKRAQVRVTTPVAALLLLVIGTAVPLPASAAPTDGVQLEFGTRTVTVRGATPGGKVVVLSSHLTVFGPTYTHRVTWNFTADVGANGVASITTPADIEPERIWLVVDEPTTNNLVARSSSETKVKRVPPGQLKHVGDAAGGAVSIPLSMAHVLVVRANEGTWLDRITDGGSSDGDGVVNGRIVITADKLTDVHGKGKKAVKFKKNDLILAIDVVTLKVVEERVP
jgi:hypothetical protein